MDSAERPAEMRPAAPGLSNEEVAGVLRRAAELDAQAAAAAQAAQVDRVATGGLSRFEPSTVEKAAREAGLSREAVQQALAELGAGALGEGATGNRLEARFARNQVVAARLVALPPQVVHARVDPYLRRQTFAPSHRQAHWAVYRQRPDLLSRLRRVVNLSGTLQLASVETVTVSVVPANPAGSASLGLPANPADLEAPAGQGSAVPAPAQGSRTGQSAQESAGQGSAVQGPGWDTAPGMPLHMVRLEGELTPRSVGVRVRTVGTGMATAGMVGLAGVILLPGLLVPATVGLASGMVVGFWQGRRLVRRRRDRVSRVLASLLDRL